MKTLRAFLAGASLATLTFVGLPILASDPAPPKTFVEMAKDMPDGKISKSMVMGAMDRTFDKADTRNEGRLDAWQAKQFQFFLREFTRDSGA